MEHPECDVWVLWQTETSANNIKTNNNMNKKFTSDWLKGASLLFLGMAFIQGIYNDTEDVDWVTLTVCLGTAILMLIAGNFINKDKDK